MTHRLQSLRALAYTLLDMQPAPKISATRAIRGEAPGAWHLCETCDGNGATLDRFKRSTVCDTCAGKGRYRVDPFTGNRVSTLDLHVAPRTRRATCDRCAGTGTMLGRYVATTGLVRCASCDGAGTVSVPLYADDTPAQTQPRLLDSPLARSRARGDWDALEEAIVRLQQADRLSARAFLRVRVAGEAALGVSQAVRVGTAETLLLSMLPDPLRCPKDALDAYRERDTRELVALARRDVSARGHRAVAELVGKVGTKKAAELLGIPDRTVRWKARAAA